MDLRLTGGAGGRWRPPTQRGARHPARAAWPSANSCGGCAAIVPRHLPPQEAPAPGKVPCGHWVYMPDKRMGSARPFFRRACNCLCLNTGLPPQPTREPEPSRRLVHADLGGPQDAVVHFVASLLGGGSVACRDWSNGGASAQLHQLGPQHPELCRCAAGATHARSCRRHGPPACPPWSRSPPCPPPWWGRAPRTWPGAGWGQTSRPKGCIAPRRASGRPTAHRGDGAVACQRCWFGPGAGAACATAGTPPRARHAGLQTHACPAGHAESAARSSPPTSRAPRHQQTHVLTPPRHTHTFMSTASVICMPSSSDLSSLRARSASTSSLPSSTLPGTASAARCRLSATSSSALMMGCGSEGGQRGCGLWVVRNGEQKRGCGVRKQAALQAAGHA
jgi:hypothetical protein